MDDDPHSVLEYPGFLASILAFDHSWSFPFVAGARHLIVRLKN